MFSNSVLSNISFGSKAETLSRLQKFSLPCLIPSFLYFTLDEWRNNQKNILGRISEAFDSAMVAVRSSALNEDGAVHSHAGAFTSVLGVDSMNRANLVHAVDCVLNSYPKPQADDQVMIQTMVGNIDASGVIMTHCVDDGSPYYVINYDDETGSCDGVTGGTGLHKTVLVYRRFKQEYCESKRVGTMLSLARSVEALCGSQPLDIEFILDREGGIHLLQVRRISTVAAWHPDAAHRVTRLLPHVERFVEELSGPIKGLMGNTTLLGNMPDWNPAELIGVIPRPMASSLFRFLITSRIWSEARAGMGYFRVPRTELMVMIAERPFIDVRASFNSFLPAGISKTLGEKIIDAWLNRLADNPMLHDKVEFEIAHTILDFSFEQTWQKRYGSQFCNQEKQEYRSLLQSLTNKTLSSSENGSLNTALSRIDFLASCRDIVPASDFGSSTAVIAHIVALLAQCRDWGTLPFCMIARHGFIAEALLRSAQAREALTPERVDDFKSSFQTVMGELSRDMLAVSRGKLSKEILMERFGHLRPGTFDIMSPSYRDRIDFFANGDLGEQEDSSRPFTLTGKEKRSLSLLLAEAGIDALDAGELLIYARKAIQGREYAKFVFTRHLSAALETIAAWGGSHGLGREDLSFLDIREIMDLAYGSTDGELTTMLAYRVDQARLKQDISRVFKLSYLIRGVQDIHVVPVHRSEPNFVTSEQVEAPSVFLQADRLNYGVLKGHIICIENADPGFDWIFTRGIAGLVTQYGGANSHMTIRCAELRLPAAIGCGEVVFRRLRKADKINLDCRAKVVNTINFI